jgi:amino acid adenylation domain-containing protein
MPSDAAANHPAAAALTLQHCFEHVSRRFPDAVAVTDGAAHLTYRQLDERADRLAETLHAAGPVGGRRIGLCLERGADLIVGMLGILKAGAAYVPIDPAYPAERRDYLLDSCDADVVVAHRATAALIKPRRAIEVDGPAGPAGQPGPARAETASGSDLAYVIFTSGSTGRPKGVLVEHRNAVRLFIETDSLFRFDERDVWCAFHSASFDFSVWEVWGALLHGARLVIVPEQTARDPQEFLRLLRRERVTVLNQTPSAFRNLVLADADAPESGSSLRYVVFGGERLDPGSLKDWVARHGLESPALVNMYGITETTVHVTWKRITEAELNAAGPSPIGAPLPGLRLEIVGADGNPRPAGEVGVIRVAGAGLARGYLDDPQLTAARFPVRPGAGDEAERWYDSGDLGVETAPGEYGYVGRADRQVKIRGYRVEPGEIEALLKGNPAVRDCVVTAADFGAGDARLVAYVVAGPGGRSAADELTAELRSAAAGALPRHMAPSAYIYIDALPVTSNGKLDQDALRDLLSAHLSGSGGGAAEPEGTVESELREIWSAVLGVGEVGPEDEFFDLGGTSFALVDLVKRVNHRFGVRLGVGVFSQGANLAVLTSAVTAQTGSTDSKEDHGVQQ